MDDVESLFEEFRLRGAVVVCPPVTRPYGMKEMAVRDPNGYVLGFGQAWSEESAANG